MSTPVAPIDDQTLKAIAQQVRAKLQARFGSEHLNAWLQQEPEIAAAFAYETFLALRIVLEHLKTKGE